MIISQLVYFCIHELLDQTLNLSISHLCNDSTAKNKMVKQSLLFIHMDTHMLSGSILNITSSALRLISI